MKCLLINMMHIVLNKNNEQILQNILLNRNHRLAYYFTFEYLYL